MTTELTTEEYRKELKKSLAAAQIRKDDPVGEALRLSDLTQEQALLIAELRRRLLLSPVSTG